MKTARKVAILRSPPTSRRPLFLRSAGPYLLLTPALVLLAFFFVVPLVIAVAFSFYERDPMGGMVPAFTLENYLRLLRTPVYTEVLLRTLRLALITTVVSLLLSYPVAYWLVRVQPRWRALALLGLIISFWSSVIVRAFAWMVLLGDTGLVNDLLAYIGIGRQLLMYNETGVVIALVHVMIPIMVFPIYGSLNSISPALEEAAEGLGASPARRFLRITLPLSLPGLASGFLLVFIITSGFFITPALLGGGRVLVIASVIVQQVGILNYPFAAVLSVMLLAVVLVVAFFFSRVVVRGKLEAGLFGG